MTRLALITVLAYSANIFAHGNHDHGHHANHHHHEADLCQDGKTCVAIIPPNPQENQHATLMWHNDHADSCVVKGAANETLVEVKGSAGRFQFLSLPNQHFGVVCKTDHGVEEKRILIPSNLATSNSQWLGNQALNWGLHICVIIVQHELADRIIHGASKSLRRALAVAAAGVVIYYGEYVEVIQHWLAHNLFPRGHHHHH